MRTDDRGVHYVDCMFCFVKEPYACPYCRAMYKNFNPPQSKKKGKVQK